MKSAQSIIQLRQHYYWLGRRYHEEGKIPEAIEAYKEYSTHLDEKDQHMPHLWISNYYKELGDVQKTLKHLEIYAAGCTPPRAAEIYKDLGEKYLVLDAIEKAIQCYELAIKNNSNIGIRKKLTELKSDL